MPEKHSSHTIPSKVVVYSVIALVALIGLWLFITPKRSVANYCKTFYAEGNNLHKQWAQQQNQTNDKLLDNLSVLAGAPGDLAIFFDKLAKVAPKEIESDITRIRDAYKKSTDADAPTDVISGIAGIAESITLGLSTQGAINRVNEYTDAHCKDYATR